MPRRIGRIEGIAEGIVDRLHRRIVGEQPQPDEPSDIPQNANGGPYRTVSPDELAQLERERLGRFTVHNATNPFREALLESGIPGIEQNPIANEHKEMTWDLMQVRQDNQQMYRAMNLEAWAGNIGTADFGRLTPEKRKTIEQEIAAGSIPIFMPDKTTQLNTTVEQFKKAFKPIWIKESQERDVNDAFLEWNHFVGLINDKAAELVEAVPDRPYIAMMNPSQKPDPRTCNKTVDDQKTEFAAINRERAASKLSQAHITNPHEYGALQTIQSQLIKKKFPTGSQPTTLRPIDSNTWTRFINLPVSVGDVPNACFVPGFSQAGFDGDDAGHPDPKRGFRLSVRVEL
ncbi:hypothetical protein EPN28_02765 [Patescibacteria group bacterium]|nr:MAG: hypothetical protein EPN28_02765 [Patescibacteria group bacterium]